MAVEIQLPRLGWSMEEGTFQGWLKKPGDSVAPGEPLFTVEGDKASQDVESTAAGILHIAADAPRPGDVVRVGTVLGYLLEADEAPPVAGAAAATTSVVSSPVDIRPPMGDPGSDSPVAPGMPEVPRKDSGRMVASPRARRTAQRLGVDLARVVPTGRTGRIRERDVLASMPANRRESPPEIQGAQRLPLSPLRRTIAARLQAGVRSSVPVTITTRCDASRLVALRRSFSAISGNGGSRQPSSPSYTDIVAKVAGRTLESHRHLAARWEDDHLVLPGAIHIGIAVDTADGLRVPVIRDAGNQSLEAIARETRRLIKAARAGRLTAGECQGGCFTISNLGAYGIDAFTPVINPPETAILGLGAIRPEPVVLEGGSVEVREQWVLSLTFDHRVVDGAPAARFLQALREALEQVSPHS